MLKLSRNNVNDDQIISLNVMIVFFLSSWDILRARAQSQGFRRLFFLTWLGAQNDSYYSSFITQLPDMRECFVMKMIALTCFSIFLWVETFCASSKINPKKTNRLATTISMVYIFEVDLTYLQMTAKNKLFYCNLFSVVAGIWFELLSFTGRKLFPTCLKPAFVKFPKN